MQLARSQSFSFEANTTQVPVAPRSRTKETNACSRLKCRSLRLKVSLAALRLVITSQNICRGSPPSRHGRSAGEGTPVAGISCLNAICSSRGTRKPHLILPVPCLTAIFGTSYLSTGWVVVDSSEESGVHLRCKHRWGSLGLRSWGASLFWSPVLCLLAGVACYASGALFRTPVPLATAHAGAAGLLLRASQAIQRIPVVSGVSAEWCVLRS